MRILIVEDERHLAEALGQIMTEQKYQVDLVFDGAEGLDYTLSGQYDAVLLDVMLPKMDGFEVARRLREAHISSPILMLTARDDVQDKISGLDCGADDYMTKPFDPGELLARVRALTRRQGEVVGNSITIGDLTLRLDARCLECGEDMVRLGFKEFEVMRLLMGGSPAVIPKEEIISRVWGLESEVVISTIRKVGYFVGGG